MKFLQLATRNVARNPRRTLITLVAIAVGLALMVLAITMQAGQHDQLREAAISSLAGDVVVERTGWAKDRRAERAVPRQTQLGAAILAEFPAAVLTRRLWLDGLVTSPSGSVGALVAAVDPAAEAAVQDVETQVVHGQWLTAGDARGLVVGVGLADSLGVKLGDKVVVMGQWGNPEVQSRLFRISGIFRTGSADLDGFTAWCDLAAGQELLAQPDAVGQLAVHLPRGTDSLAATSRVAAISGALLGPDADVEVLHWKEALPELSAMLALDKNANDFMMVILGVMVAIGVLNTVLMSVMERSREFGVLLAIGLRPRRLAGLVLLETLVLGIVGASLGVLLGVLLGWPLVHYGLDYTAMLGDTYEAGGIHVSSVIQGRYAWDRVFAYFLGAIAMTVASALWPAWTVTRLTPVEAMRKA